MKLKIPERQVLSRLLPTQGDFTTISLVADVRKRLALTEQEVEAMEYKVVSIGVNSQGQEMSRSSWNKSKDLGVEIEIGEIVTKVIVDALEKLQKEEKIEESHLPLYSKFVKEKEKAPTE